MKPPLVLINKEVLLNNTTLKKYIIILSVLVFSSCKESVDYYTAPSFSSNNFLNAVIEIPAGTNKKFEYNKEHKKFEIDRLHGKERIIEFLPYPGNYGYIPSTYSDPKKGGDGDALDILVLSESKSTGTVMEVIPIAMLKLVDDGELDYKIIAIPIKESDQIIKATSLKELSEEYPQVKQIIELWFLNYNKHDEARVFGWGDKPEALKEINLNRL